MQNNKSAFSDKMIKVSLQEMMSAYLKFFNSILTSGIMPNTWCRGLITPIYKSGGRNEPSNYRGICVSSCLNQRLLEHVNSPNILHNSQIGFLPKNRTADHVLTLRTLVGKYVHVSIYACFVDFKKAFHSVNLA